MEGESTLRSSPFIKGLISVFLHQLQSFIPPAETEFLQRDGVFAFQSKPAVDRFNQDDFLRTELPEEQDLEDGQVFV
jgi:hypothetical protein